MQTVRVKDLHDVKDVEITRDSELHSESKE